MKRSALWTIILSVLLAGAGWRQAAGQPSTSNKSTEESRARVRQKTFEIVWRTVKEKYFDPTFNGLDWDKVRERYAPQVAAVKSDGELYKLLNKMLSELKVSHLGIVPPEAIEATAQSPASTGIDFNILDGLAVITRVSPDSSAERAGLRPGFVIKKIGDTVVEAQEFDALLDSLTGAPQTEVQLSYLDERDQAHEVTLVRQRVQTDAERYKDVSLYAEFEAKRLAGGIGYIRFSQFVTGLNKKIRDAIISMSDAPGLIIDLRGNGGGDDEVGIKMANLLFNKKTVLMITKTRKGDDDYYHAQPEKRPFLGTVVILQDERSGSASEQFAAGMQEANRAVVIGTRSPGDDMDADLKKLPTGAYLIYPYGQPRTPKGVVIEGRGVIPDIEVRLTRAALLSGVDAQLAAAIEYIQKHARGASNIKVSN